MQAGRWVAAARVAIHSVFSLALTWPLVWWLGAGLPNGTESAGTVAYFNLWTFRWNQQQFADLFRDYWDAPSFHPEAGTFALSDPQPLTGLAFAPASWLTGDPVIAYNAIVLLALTLNGVACARLSRQLGVGSHTALLIGLLAQALPFAMDQLGVIQLAMVFPLLFLADAILAWADSATWPRALAIGGWLSATLFTCGYYGLFALIVVVPAAAVLVRRDWFGRRLLQLAGAAALFGVVCSPFFLAQARYTSGYSRPERVLVGNSAPPGAYLMLNRRLPGADIAPWLRDDAPLPLYPGTIALGLAVVGTVIVIRQRQGYPERVRAAAFLGAAITLAVLISFGLNLSVFGWQPYRLLREHAPGFAILRTPFRTAVIAQAFLLPVAAVALDQLWSFVPRPNRGVTARDPDEPPGSAVPDGQEPEAAPAPVGAADRGPRLRGAASRITGPDRPWVGRGLASVLVVIALAEIWPAPQQLIEAPPVGRGTDWVDWLAEPRDPGDGDGSIAMVPFPPDGNYRSYEPTTVWMVAGLDHDRPLVNGYSSLFPPSYDELEHAMRDGFPSVRSIELLARYRVSFVVVARSWLEADDHQVTMEQWSAVLQPAFQGSDTVIYTFAPIMPP